MSDRIIHGLAVPFNEWVSPFDDEDPMFSHTFLVRPGAFADALARTDKPMRLTAFDHAYDVGRWTKSILASVSDGTLLYWQEPRGLMFEATINSWDPRTADRVYELVKRGWITRCCLAIAAGTFPPGTKVEITRVPSIGDLGLLLIGTAHCKSAYVREGAAPDGPRLQTTPSDDVTSDMLYGRVLS